MQLRRLRTQTPRILEVVAFTINQQQHCYFQRQEPALGQENRTVLRMDWDGINRASFFEG